MTWTIRIRSWKRQMMATAPRLTTRLTGFGLVALAVVTLQFVSSVGWVSAFVVPPPSNVLASAVDLYVSEHIVYLFFLTTAMTFIATALSALIGLPFGWLLARYPAYGMAYESWLGAAFSAPIILLYPLFLVLVGRGLHTIVIMGMAVGVIPIAMKTLEGFQAVPRVFLNVASALNMTQRQRTFKVLVPAALPTIFVGIRLALIYVMINIIALEFLLSLGGLGLLVAEMYDRFDIPGMYAAILFVILCSVLFFEVIERLERWLTAR